MEAGIPRAERRGSNTHSKVHSDTHSDTHSDIHSVTHQRSVAQVDIANIETQEACSDEPSDSMLVEENIAQIDNREEEDSSMEQSGDSIGIDQYQSFVEKQWPRPTIHAYTKSYEHMALYFDVRRHNVPNYLGARKEVPSQLNCDNWDIALMSYSDHEICDFLRYGWPISYSMLQIPQATKKNHPSAREFDQDVSAFIHKECKLGAMLHCVI